jgi:hypothetical protein
MEDLSPSDYIKEERPIANQRIVQVKKQTIGQLGNSN